MSFAFSLTVLFVPVTRKALDWLSMAEEDLDDSDADLREGRYGSSVFHAELSAQKCVKGVIVALGFEPGKTHRPSLVLRGLMIGGLIELPEEEMRLLDRLVSLSLVLEDQGVAPRYGWETIDRVIKPSEIYDEEKTHLLVANAREVFRIAKQIIEGLDC